MSAYQQSPVGEMCCVFTDIVDSTNMWEQNQEAMQVALTMHDAIIRAEMVHFGGYEVKTLGDGFMVSFCKPESALQFCLAAQKKLKATSWPREIVDYALHRPSWDRHSNYLRRGVFRVRMGIHFGVPFSCNVNRLTGRMDYYGYMVNMASRIQSEADGDEIALSDDFIVKLHRCRSGQVLSTNDLTHLIRASITCLEFSAAEFRVRSKGLRPLRGVHNPEHIFLIVLRR
jgi:adenylate cyclase